MPVKTTRIEVTPYGMPTNDQNAEIFTLNLERVGDSFVIQWGGRWYLTGTKKWTDDPSQAGTWSQTSAVYTASGVIQKLWKDRDSINPADLAPWNRWAYVDGDLHRIDNPGDLR